MRHYIINGAHCTLKDYNSEVHPRIIFASVAARRDLLGRAREYFAFEAATSDRESTCGAR